MKVKTFFFVTYIFKTRRHDDVKLVFLINDEGFMVSAAADVSSCPAIPESYQIKRHSVH